MRTVTGPISLPAVVFAGWLTKLSDAGAGHDGKAVRYGTGQAVRRRGQRIRAGHGLGPVGDDGLALRGVRYGPLLSVPSLTVMAVPAVVTTLPKLSLASTMNGLSAVPALPLPGWVRKTSWLAAAGLDHKRAGKPRSPALRSRSA